MSKGINRKKCYYSKFVFSVIFSISNSSSSSKHVTGQGAVAAAVTLIINYFLPKT